MLKSQNRITAFFSPKSAGSRSESQASPSPSIGHAAKRQKTEENSNDVVGTPPTTPQPTSTLTPQQRERARQNQAEAQMKLMEKKGILLTGMGPSWFRALESEFSKPYYQEISEYVTTERQSKKIFPAPNDVFSWTKHCEFNAVRVVILGQDPYHGPRQAHGLCFSVQKGVAKPPSLVNIFKELETDLGKGFVTPQHGDLTGWAKQGVLLLNTALTVRQGQANSHSQCGWHKFTDAVISAISTKRAGVIFLLWGAPAQEKKKLIDSKKHHILTAPHPSPLSVYRGFFGCKHFSKANQLLKDAGYTPINWSDLP